MDLHYLLEVLYLIILGKEVLGHPFYLFIVVLKSDKTHYKIIIIFRKNDLKEIQEYFPLAELMFIEGAGHWVHSQKPEKFLEAVCKFLEEK